MNRNIIPYGRQSLDDDDISAVLEVLRSDWLTTGPKVEEFEKLLAEFTGADYAIAVSSGTAGLHTAYSAIGIGPGAEVIVPAMTFSATANAVVMLGGKPVFCDVLPDNLLINPVSAESKITSRTKAICAVDYTGHPADYDRLKAICQKHNLLLVADSSHSLGAKYRGLSPVKFADISVLSFHPVKHITTGEGGMVLTDNRAFADKARRFRNHGLDSDFRNREQKASHYYEMVELGYNYRLTDIQCALGISQMKKLPTFLKRRSEIADYYYRNLKDNPAIEFLKVSPEVEHAYHLFVIKLNLETLKADRNEIFTQLRQAGIGVNVHYLPVHLHPFYRERFGTKAGDCPVAESVYERILTLPMYPKLTQMDLDFTITATLESIFYNSI